MAKYIKALCGYCEFAENGEKHYFECDKHKVFAQIATDQRKIDIEKACEEFNTFVDKVMSEKFEREWCAAAKIRFRQNLEEEQ